MKDATLCSLVRSLDALVEDGHQAIEHDVERAALRLACLTRRLGPVAEDSPYLRFLRRCCQRRGGEDAVAASA